MSEPMSDERIAEIEQHRGRDYQELCEFCARATDDLLAEVHRLRDELLAEVHRLRDVPPEVAAAMERYRGHEFGKGNWPYEGALYDVITLATWAVSHHRKDGA